MQKHPYFDLCQQQKFDIGYYLDYIYIYGCILAK